MENKISQSKLLKAAELLFNVYDKRGALVPFHMNEVQRRLDQSIVVDGNNRVSILKARQEGVSTFVMIYFLIECLYRHCTCVMLAHDRDHTEKLLQRARLILTNMNGPKPKTGKLNDNEIFFSKTQSSFYIGTAGNVNFGRSATITHLHCSEIAFWNDPKTLLTGLLQAVPKDTGIVIQETTANGWGTWFQKQYYRYMSDRGAFKAIFLPWFDHAEYVSRIPASPPFTDYETFLMNQFGLTLHQIQWRREKLEEFDGDESLFRQEYPATVEEAFRITGGSLFSGAKLEQTKDWGVHGSIRNVEVLRGHPSEGYHYVIGADPAGGTGNDFSAAVGICVETGQQVLTYRNNTITPPDFGMVLADLGKKFNTALIVPESNSHGLSVVSVLRQSYPVSRIYRSSYSSSQMSLNIPAYGYGWKTTTTSKPYMVGVAQRFIAENRIHIHDPILYEELLSFSETDTGKLQGMGDHDDTAMAFMLACIGMLRMIRNMAFYQADPNSSVKDELSARRKAHEVTWRDGQGRFLLKTDDILGKKRKVKRAW